MSPRNAWKAPKDTSGNRALLIAARDREPIVATVGKTSLALERIDCSGAIGRRAIIRRIANALDFPAWFGGNWDALADCLDDLSWRPGDHGRVLLIDGLEGCRLAQPEVFDLLIELLDDVAQRYGGRDAIFQALVVLPSQSFDAMQ